MVKWSDQYLDGPGHGRSGRARTLEAVRRDLRVVMSPRLLPVHLLGIVFTTAAILLGLWQLDVWQAHREAAARDLTHLAPAPLDRVLGPDQPFPSSALGRPVDLTGKWLPSSTFYVTDRKHAGRTGFWVVTPVAVCSPGADCAEASALLVVRGWTADPAKAPAAPDARVSIRGWLQPPEDSGVPDPDAGDRRLPEVRLPDAVQWVNQDLYSAFLVARHAEPHAGLAGLASVGPQSVPQPDSFTGLRNFLYAIQWWVFAGFGLVAWYRWVRDEVHRSGLPSGRLDADGRRVPSKP